jgi:uncharacterized protein
MPALRLKVLPSIADAGKEAWNALLPPGAPPVLRYEWISALEESGCATARKGWQPAHLAAYRGSALVAAAPAYLKSHSMGEYVYDFGWASAAQSMGVSYYPKLLMGVPLSPLTAPRFLVAPGEDAPALRATLLAAALDLARDSGCSSVHVIFPPDEEARQLEGSGLYPRATLQYHWKNPGYASYDDYLGRFDSKRRNQLKRERAAAAGQGIRVFTVPSQDIGEKEAELAWRFYEATASRHSWGPLQLNRAFFRQAFRDLSPHIEMVLAEREGQVVAGAFNLHTSTHLYGRYWGAFEEHPFLHFHVCLYHSVEACIVQGRRVFEPGAGGEHKISRGFEPTRINSLHTVFDARLDRAVRDFCRREAAQVAQLVAESAQVAGMKPLPAPLPPKA